MLPLPERSSLVRLIDDELQHVTIILSTSCVLPTILQEPRWRHRIFLFPPSKASAVQELALAHICPRTAKISTMCFFSISCAGTSSKQSINRARVGTEPVLPGALHERARAAWAGHVANDWVLLTPSLGGKKQLSKMAEELWPPPRILRPFFPPSCLLLLPLSSSHPRPSLKHLLLRGLLYRLVILLSTCNVRQGCLRLHCVHIWLSYDGYDCKHNQLQRLLECCWVKKNLSRKSER